MFPRAQPGYPAAGKKRVTFTQHCELTLALEMLARHAQSKVTKSQIEIGVTKACCEWCRQYLSLASIYSKHQILVRDSHGKQPDGWMIPPNGPKSVTNQMKRVIGEKVDDVIWEIRGPRRSDSNELPDSTRGDADLKARKQVVAKNKLF